MTLEIRKTSRWWYGRWMRDGKRHCARLKVQVKGEPGSTKLEESRQKAQTALDAMILGEQESKRPEDLVQEIHRVKFGHRIGSIAISGLFKAWKQIPRKRQPKPQYVAWAESIFERLQDFIKEQFSHVKEMAIVEKSLAEAFMRHEAERGVSPKTYNAELILLRGAFEHLREDAGMLSNPFSRIVTRDAATVHRKPFAQEELQSILNAADDDPLIRPVIVTGMCTAMRRGDCCLLRWADLDMKERFVRVKTAKTGETVEIPMFPRLRAEIEQHGVEGGEFVFPMSAKLYQKSAQGITRRVRCVFEAAGFYNEEVEKEVKKEGEKKGEKKDKPAADLRPLLPAHDLLTAGLKVLADLPEGAMDPAKRERMKEAFKTYVNGASLPKITRDMGISKSSVSLYLHEMDRRTGLRVLRTRCKKEKAKRRGDVRATRKEGLRRASVRDFHSFRVTWITLALTAGVPMELVTRVTGHQTVNVVLKHYFRPGREDFRHAIEGAMPRLLMESTQPSAVAKEPVEILADALKALDAMKAKTWQKQRNATLLLVRQAQEQLSGHVVKAVVNVA